MDNNIRNLNFNTDDFNDKNNIYNISSFGDINLEISCNQKQKEEIIQDIVENFINQKLMKENEHKYQIGQTKKSVLEKFYSISSNDYLNQQSKNKLHEIEFNFIQQNKIIPNNQHQSQKEYDEIREKYKNERNKKKSSIFKSEDLHISNTDIVHIKKEDYSPINPNLVDIENKNNIIILQKKLFGDDNNEEGEDISPMEKIEDIDDIELDFSEINNNKYEESEIVCSNYKNKNLESESNTENKNKNNEEVNINIFNNDILEEKREIDLCFRANYNKIDINLKINKYLKLKQKSKNYSVQLVSSVGYLKNNLSNNNNNKKRENNYFSNNIDNFIHENNKINDGINNHSNNLGNNDELKQNFISDYNYLNGKSDINKENCDNDNSNNTIVLVNNNDNNYNGIYNTYENKKMNGSNINYDEKNQKDNKYHKENKILGYKNSNKNNPVSYLYHKNFSNRFPHKNNINQNNINYLVKNLKKPKILKKKNNSFISIKDIYAMNNIILNHHQELQTMKNKNSNLKNNKDYNNAFHAKKNLLNYNNIINGDKTINNNKIIPVISKKPISIKANSNIISKMTSKNHFKENSKKIGNKIAVINTLLNNNLILFQKNNHQKEAIEKLKARPNNGVYFIYVDKTNEGYSFKGIYKRGASEVNHICNKIFGIPNTPLMLSYERFYILVENDNKNFEFRKLRDINVLSFIKTILLIKNK